MTPLAFAFRVFLTSQRLVAHIACNNGHESLSWSSGHLTWTDSLCNRQVQPRQPIFSARDSPNTDLRTFWGWLPNDDLLSMRLNTSQSWRGFKILQLLIPEG
ncbi:hypothetical protein BKA66DRAFT_472351 [Pyrenochaeta sp. MPI-SDFR-AT-0127]|nr:hypothetical protein BKA66DRAFT_472351 [Pyrenochaeta sp. MPI-SDFR-AT-0127]